MNEYVEISFMKMILLYLKEETRLHPSSQNVHIINPFVL